MEYLLWWDGAEKRTLSEKLGAALARYKRKFGVDANVCYVHPSTVKETQEMHGIPVIPRDTVLCDHLMVGVEAT